MQQPRRLFVEKREGFRVEASSLLRDFNENLSLSLGSLRLVNVYDLFGFSDELVEKCRYTVFGETVTDEGGASVTVSGTGNTRTFTMPAKSVTVAATFALPYKKTGTKRLF